MQTWQWKYNAEQEELQLRMDGGFKQALNYRSKHLRPHIEHECSFNLSDASMYGDLTDYLDRYYTTSFIEKRLIASHAVGTVKFGKGQMAQSWHFISGTVEQWPASHQLCTLHSKYDAGTFLIIESDERTALCMLLDDNFKVFAPKTMQRFEVIRVFKDSLHSHQQHAVEGDDWFRSTTAG